LLPHLLHTLIFLLFAAFTERMFEKAEDTKGGDSLLYSI
jgi:hypothetical protein